MEHPHVTRLREFYGAFAKGDVDTLVEDLSPEVVWHVSGARPVDHVGRDAVLSFLRGLHEATHDVFMIEAHAFLADEEHGVVLAHVTAERDGKRYSADEVHVFHLDDEGRIVEAWGFTADPQGQGEFFF